MDDSHYDDFADNAGRASRLSTWAPLIVIGAAVAVVAVIVLSGAGGDRDRGANSAAAGKSLPADWSIVQLAPESATLTADELRGSVAVFSFWGYWCGPCRVEMPELLGALEEFGDRPDFRFLAVTCLPDPRAETPDDLLAPSQKFIDSLNLPRTPAIYYDPGANLRTRVNRVAGFSGYPTTMVLDREGVIRGYWVGYIPGDEKNVAKLVRDLLAN